MKYDYVTVFRDPIDRAWSQYQHNGKRRCRCKFTKFSETHSNYYQHKLCGVKPGHPLQPKQDVKLAVKNLQNYTLVGNYLNDLETWFKSLDPKP